MLKALLYLPDVERVSSLRIEVVGPRMLSVVGEVDLAGDDTQAHVAIRWRSLELRTPLKLSRDGESARVDGDGAARLALEEQAEG